MSCTVIVIKIMVKSLDGPDVKAALVRIEGAT